MNRLLTFVITLTCIVLAAVLLWFHKEGAIAFLTFLGSPPRYDERKEGSESSTATVSEPDGTKVAVTARQGETGA